MINETVRSRERPGRPDLHGVIWRSLLAGLLLVTSCGDGSTGPGNEGPASATRLAITTQPSSGAQSGVAFSTQPVVQLRDASGNSVSQSGVSVTASIASGGGFLGGATTVATNASGQATFTNLQITGALGDRTLSFTSGALTATTSSTINVNTAGAETQLFIATQPSDATSGAPFVQQPVIQLQDASGNNVSKAGVDVTVELASGSGDLTGAGAIRPGGALSAEETRARGLPSRASRATVQTDANGIASFTSLTITGQLDHTLVFLAAGLTSAFSDVFSVAPPPPVVLTDGVGVPGLAGNAGEALYYVITVPAAAPQLDAVTSGGAGDVDLYVRVGALPTTSMYDCRGNTNTNQERCTFESPASGDWFIMLVAFDDYSGVTLTASVAITGCTLTTPGDADGDRLPDCVETNTGVYLSSLDTGTDPDKADTDGDYISDGDEVLGTLAGLDLPGLGVNPLVPNILIEYDWFDDGTPTHTHRPTATQIAMVTASFAAQGVVVIHDYGQGPAPFDRGNLISDADGNVDGLGTEYYDYKAANFDANRDGYFHYNMHPHQYNFGGSSGLAEINGDDFITATGNFTTNDLAVAGTIQHELGHNLGLLHGGPLSMLPNSDINYKPNYNSVMSYTYQFSGVDDDCTPTPDGVLDYSSGGNPPLDETDLSEPLGICGGLPGWDWNQDGDVLDLGVIADINPEGIGDSSLDVLFDFDDWGNLNYIGITDFDGAAAGSRARQLAFCQAFPG